MYKLEIVETTDCRNYETVIQFQRIEFVHLTIIMGRAFRVLRLHARDDEHSFAAYKVWNDRDTAEAVDFLLKKIPSLPGFEKCFPAGEQRAMATRIGASLGSDKFSLTMVDYNDMTLLVGEECVPFKITFSSP